MTSFLWPLLLLAATLASAASQDAPPTCARQVCADEEPAAFVQKNVILQRRGAGEKDSLLKSDAKMPAKGMEPPSMAEVAELSDSAIEPGLNAQHGMDHNTKSRTSTHTVLVCVMTLFVLAASSGACWLAGEYGWKTEALKLPTLIFTFALSYWALNIVDHHVVVLLNTPMIVTCAQMLLTALFCFIVAPRDIFSGTAIEVLTWCIVPCVFFTMMITSFFSYQHFALTMIVRNITPLVAMPLETLFMPADKQPIMTIPMVMSLGIVAASTLLYCNTFQISFHGFGMAFLNMALVAIDCLLQRRLLTNECKGLSTWSCLFINNISAFFPTLLLAIYWEEFSKLSMALWIDTDATVLLVLAGMVGACLSYSAIALQRVVTATSFIVIQNLVRVFVVLVGALVFLDVLASPFAELGLAMSFAGAGWYGKTQLDGMRKKEMAAEEKMARDAWESFVSQSPQKLFDTDAKVQTPKTEAS